MTLASSFFIFSIFVFIILIIANFVKGDPNLQKNAFFIYLTFFVVFFFIAINTTYSKLDSTQLAWISLSPMFSLFVGVILFAVMVIYFFYFMQLIRSEYIYFLLSIFIFIITWSFLYFLFKNTLTSAFYSSFFGQFIAFLPCLIYDMFQYLLQDSLTTPRFLILLLLIEIVFIVLYFYLPDFVVYLYNLNHTVLLREAVFLDEHHALKPIPQPDSNYAISFWVNVSAKSSSKEFVLFKSQNGPQLNYLDSETANTFVAYFNNSLSEKYAFAMPFQIWNYVVFNYRGNICDLFINGKLIHSHTLETVSPLFPHGKISVGETQGGIYGSIANVAYFPKPLSLSYIQTTYSLLRYKNPPVVVA